MNCAVCLNPCIDRTVEIEEFTYAGMNRILTSRSDGCGKGVNVALASRELGMDSALIGYLYEEKAPTKPWKRLEPGGRLTRGWGRRDCATGATATMWFAHERRHRFIGN